MSINVPTTCFACVPIVNRKFVVHASRDRILLEGEENLADEDLDEDEVFALNGLETSSEGEEQDEQDEENFAVGPVSASALRKRSKERTSSKKVTASVASDEEQDESDNESEEGWGKKKSAYYSSNAGAIESDDEEGIEMEEQEARRLQMKVRDDLMEDDFGLGDPVVETKPLTEDTFEYGPLPAFLVSS
jgi:U3 small nucleolar RNA-associated protein 3